MCITVNSCRRVAVCVMFVACVIGAHVEATGHDTEENADAGWDPSDWVQSLKETIIDLVGTTDADELFAKLKQKLTDIESTPVKLGFVGETGVGKSTLVNTLRNLRRNDLNAARVGITETTSERACYSHPKALHLELCDVPGMNSPNFSSDPDVYAEQVELKTLDAMVVVTAARLHETDVALIQWAHSNKVPVVMVRTKVNIDVKEHLDPDEEGFDDSMFESPEADEVVQKARDDLCNQINEKLPGSLVSCFAVSGKLVHLDLFDMPALREELVDIMPDIKKNQLRRNLPGFTVSWLNAKKEACEELIHNYALAAAVSGALNPIPFADIAVDIGIMVKLQNALLATFGLSASDVDRLQSTYPSAALTLAVAEVAEVALSQFIKKMLRKAFVAKAFKHIPIVGILARIVGGPVDYYAARTVGNQLLDRIYTTAVKVHEALF